MTIPRRVVLQGPLAAFLTVVLLLAVESPAATALTVALTGAAFVFGVLLAIVAIVSADTVGSKPALVGATTILLAVVWGALHLFGFETMVYLAIGTIWGTPVGNLSHELLERRRGRTHRPPADS